MELSEYSVTREIVTATISGHHVPVARRDDDAAVLFDLIDENTLNVLTWARETWWWRLPLPSVKSP